jgi:uncharacterized BrkB/YihY/UPF0761 family membrane protein
MKPSIFTVPIVCVILIAPLVLFQGKPETLPNWLTEYYMGIPGTVMATTLWFIATILLTWYVGTANADHLSEEE